MPFSATGLLSDSKITLEKSASDAFGASVDTFTKNSLGGFLKSGVIDNGSSIGRSEAKATTWNATSYAAALSGGTSYRPKLNFLFKVEFQFTQAAINAYREVLDNTKRQKFEFMIKSVDRPKYDFEYEEDVNMYNFRTKVLKKIRHQDLSMIFMDDTGNRVFDFFRTMMMIHQPITERQMQRDNSMRGPDPASQSLPHGSGMTFSNGPADSKNLQDFAHRGVVNPIGGNVGYGNTIEYIRVKQIYVNPGENLNSSVGMVTFDFINPRVVSFDLGELSHESNEVSTMTMRFDYDWMEMVKVGPLGVNNKPYEKDFDIPVAGVSGAPSDITAKNTGAAAVKSLAGGAGNALFNSLSSIAGRSVSQLTSDAIGKVVSKAGGGQFAASLGGIVSSSVSGPISSIISGAGRSLFSSGGLSSPNSTNARATASAVSDSSTAGSDRPISVVSASNAYTGSDPAVPGTPYASA